ncbi:MAG: hypothetical protein HY366_01550 [Candidatus Aenigmarchaeota archaeon]|nr:hypothetical protein [Candidatus Aenigmarchaeota archaeon]
MKRERYSAVWKRGVDALVVKYRGDMEFEQFISDMAIQGKIVFESSGQKQDVKYYRGDEARMNEVLADMQRVGLAWKVRYTNEAKELVGTLTPDGARLLKDRLAGSREKSIVETIDEMAKKVAG